MLVIKITQGDSLVLSNGISIHYGERNGNYVTMAIEAPSDVRISRARIRGKFNELNKSRDRAIEGEKVPIAEKRSRPSEETPVIAHDISSTISR